MRHCMEKILRSVVGDDAAEVGASDDLIQRAALQGFELANYETESGQRVWEWRHGDGPRPRFVTERVARHWMSEWIERSAAAFPDTLAPRRRANTAGTAERAPDVAESA